MGTIQTEKQRFDVFICHAAEDKGSVVRPIADALTNAGLHVWYDEFSLRLGDSLNKSIELGVSLSEFALVILSPSFFAKKWPRKELDALAAQELKKGKPRILPVWHNVSATDVQRFSPLLADRLAITTSEGLDQLVQKVKQAVVSGSHKGRPTCFIIRSYDDSYQEMLKIIISALLEAGVVPVSIEIEPGINEFDPELVNKTISGADFVLVDISSCHPNVFFELGIAYAMGIPVILLRSTKSPENLGYDLSGYHYLTYDPRDLETFAVNLRRVARRYADARRVKP